MKIIKKIKSWKDLNKLKKILKPGKQQGNEAVTLIIFGLVFKSHALKKKQIQKKCKIYI